MLNDKQIKLFLGHLIQPWNDELVQPASLDVRLGAGVKVPIGNQTLVVGLNKPEYDEYQLPYTLAPGEFALFHTLETFHFLNNIAGKFEGKSSLGRIGLMTHVTAGFIDPGFRGQLTLELCNVGKNPLVLVEGVRIGQVAFFEIAPVGHTYDGHYQDSVGAVGAQI